MREALYLADREEQSRRRQGFNLCLRLTAERTTGKREKEQIRVR